MVHNNVRFANSLYYATINNNCNSIGSRDEAMSSKISKYNKKQMHCNDNIASYGFGLESIELIAESTLLQIFYISDIISFFCKATVWFLNQDATVENLATFLASHLIYNRLTITQLCKMIEIRLPRKNQKVFNCFELYYTSCFRFRFSFF